MKVSKNKVMNIVEGGLLAVSAGLLLYATNRFGEYKLIRELIDLYEEGNNNATVTDHRTGLIYEIALECIGD